jgi:hypothetical protein
MSELKDYDIMDIEAMDDERLEKSESGIIQVTRVYIKSEADEAFAELEEQRRWRSVSEELPSHDTWCIVYHEGEIDVDHYTDDCNSHDRFVMYGDYVTHWMPLPKTPEK